jgi:type I restriction enzyme R subunit
MSELLDALINERRQQAIDYKEYLEKVKELSVQVVNAGGINPCAYPASINTSAKKSLYDNLEKNEALALQIDSAVKRTKKADWIGHRIREREVAAAISKVLNDDNLLHGILELVKNQYEYR